MGEFVPGYEASQRFGIGASKNTPADPAATAVLTVRHALPTVYYLREYAEVDGLISAKSVGCLSPRRCLRRPDSQGRKARRPAGKTWDRIRTDHRATSSPHPVDKVPKFQSSIISHNSVVKPFHCCVREPAAMNSTVIKRSVRIDGHTTSVTLEDDFWNSLKEIAHQRNETVSQLIARIDEERKTANLSSVLRLFVLAYYQDQCASSKLVDLAHEDVRPIVA